MKSFILLLFVWAAFYQAKAQMKEAVLFEDTLCVNTDSPLLLMKGTAVKIGCDSAYLINPRRYALYQRLHQHIKEVSVAGNCQPLMAAYEKALLETQISYEALHQQYSQAEQLTVQWIRESEQAMKQMQQTLVQAEQTVTQANQHLTEARQIVKEERRKNIVSKACIGLGGVGFGILTGVLLIP